MRAPGWGPERPTLATLVAALAVVVAGLLAVPSSVLAACATAPQSAEDAVFFGDVVFVGTVLRTENEGRWPTVRLEERWKGAGDLADTVVVRGGPEPGTATTTDRTYLPGRYLFVVDNQDGVLVDNACTGTRAWTEDLAPLRPAGVEPAAAELPTDPLGSINPGQLAAVAGLLAALLVAIVAYLYVLRARRRPPDWIR
ncbi:MAG TPA: hypothetical protein VFL03_14205 [Candidatus Limnocylindrales bacterium]|jgi:hypothetical protein|nr:hypothetical protein [Candidatus Limnocylindrales bacterium]